LPSSPVAAPKWSARRPPDQGDRDPPGGAREAHTRSLHRSPLNTGNAGSAENGYEQKYQLGPWLDAKHSSKPNCPWSILSSRNFPRGISNGLSGERKFRIFQEVVEEDDEFAHDGSERVRPQVKVM
jgi:hypothetical protein